MLIVAAVSLLYLISESTSECPPEGSIPYCSCHEIDSKLDMVCSVSDIAHLVFLSENFRHDLKSLRIQLDAVRVFPSSVLFYDKLKTLILSGYNLTTVNSNAFVGLEENLSMLVLSHTNLQEIPISAISRLQKLQLLLMHHNQITSLNVSLRNFTLDVLDLHHNKISRIERGVFPESLSILDLSHNCIFSLNKSLEGSLTSLDISYNHISNLDGEFDKVPGLGQLIAEGNWITTIDECFRGLYSLTNLYLAHNHITELGGGLSGLSDLANLDLSYNGLTNISVLSLRGNRHLKTIDLSHNNIHHLKEGLFDCLLDVYFMDISYNHIRELNFLVSSQAIRGRSSEIEEETQDEYCSFRDNPKLENLTMRDSGAICDEPTRERIVYLRSKGTIVNWSPCDVNYEEM